MLEAVAIVRDRCNNEASVRRSRGREDPFATLRGSLTQPQEPLLCLVSRSRWEASV